MSELRPTGTHLWKNSRWPATARPGRPESRGVGTEKKIAVLTQDRPIGYELPGQSWFGISQPGTRCVWPRPSRLDASWWSCYFNTKKGDAMTTVNLPEDLEHFIRDAVHTGRFASADSVIIDALVQLRKAIGASVEDAAQGAEPGGQGKLLTKQAFQQHLVKIGLLDQPDQAVGTAGNPDQAVVDNEEILSEVMIRERLIQWLTSFLS